MLPAWRLTLSLLCCPFAGSLFSSAHTHCLHSPGSNLRFTCCPHAGCQLSSACTWIATILMALPNSHVLSSCRGSIERGHRAIEQALQELQQELRQVRTLAATALCLSC